MANVTVDIPGIGSVEARNAATESTLRELVNAIKGLEKTTAAGDKAAGQAAQSAPAAASGGAAGGMAQAGSAVGKSAKGMAGALAGTGKTLLKFGNFAAMAASAVLEFATATSQKLGDLADIEDSISSAANSIPLLNTFFGPIAGAIEKSVNAFQSASESGATFGGSVMEMNRAASAAGMTLDKFASLVGSNGEAMRLLGGTTEEGARRFAALSKELRRGGAMQGLNNLGFSTQQINEGMASYVEILGRTGKIEGKTNAQLAQGSAKYLKELDLLAKVTGQSRKEAEEAQKKLLNDAQYQAKVASMGTEAADSFRNSIAGLPGPLQDIAKDIMVTGSATTEESQKFSALMPQSAEMMRQFAEVTNKGGTITQEMRNRLNETMRIEGQTAKLQYQDQGRFNKDLAGSYMGIVAAANIQKDALNKAAAGQEKTNKTTDNMAAAAEGFRRMLAEVSNAFTGILAGSGMMTAMMDSFGLFVDFTKAVILPVFRVLATVIKHAVTVVKAVLTPVLTAVSVVLNSLASGFDMLQGAVSTIYGPMNTLSSFVNDAVMGAFKGLIDLWYGAFLPAFYAVSDFIEDRLVPVIAFFQRNIDEIASLLKNAFYSALESVSNFLNNYFLEPFKKVASWFSDTFKPILDYIAPVLSAIGDIFSDIGARVDRFVNGFSSLSDVTDYLTLQWDKLALGFQEFMLWLDKSTELHINEEEKKAFEEREKALAEKGDAIKKREEENQAKRDRTADTNEAAQSATRKKLEEERKKRDAALAKAAEAAKKNVDRLGKSTGVGAEAQAEANAAAKEAMEIDYSSPEAVAKSFFTQQKSDLVKDARKSESIKNLGTKQDELKEARKSGDKDKIKAAEASLKEAEKQYRDIDKQFKKEGAKRGKVEDVVKPKKETPKEVEKPESQPVQPEETPKEVEKPKSQPVQPEETPKEVEKPESLPATPKETYTVNGKPVSKEEFDKFVSQNMPNMKDMQQNLKDGIPVGMMPEVPAGPNMDVKKPVADAEGQRKFMETDFLDEYLNSSKEKEAKLAEAEAAMKNQPTLSQMAQPEAQDPMQTAIDNLNNTLTSMLREQRASNRVLQRQLSVQEGLSGDLYASV